MESLDLFGAAFRFKEKGRAEAMTSKPDSENEECIVLRRGTGDGELYNTHSFMLNINTRCLQSIQR